MKKVTFKFIGYKSEDVAKSFYTWVVDGGLEDSIIENLSSEDISIDGLSSWDNTDLEITIKSKHVSQGKEGADENTDLIGVAILNQKETPNKLYIHGSTLVYGENDEVTITERVPGGFNPSILFVDINITEKPGHKKGHTVEFSFEKECEDFKYSQVSFFINNDMVKTINVRKVG